MPFYNPYHFIPVKKRTDRTKDITTDAMRDGQLDGHSHDHYDNSRFSGRLICKLTTESPVVVGAKQEGDSLKRVIPFELEDGTPAIPASTLRGMLSSLIEAASNSTLRVLDEKRSLSYRQPMNNSLSAIGMIVETAKGLHLRPLALPSLNRNGKRQYELPERFRRLFSKYAAMQVYVDVPPGTRGGICYLKTQDGWDISSGTISTSKDLRHPRQKIYVSIDNGKRIDSKVWQRLSRDEQGKFRKEKEPNPDFVIGQQPNGSSTPLTCDEWNHLPNHTGYVRGYLRVMRHKDRTDIPGTKTHELFIPAPDEPEKQNDTIAIPQPVLDTFYALAYERSLDKLDKDGRLQKNETEMTLHPYHPVGTDRNSGATGKEQYLLKLKQDDLVYFDVDNEGAVNALSFSSIWRGSAGIVKDYFENVDKELLPFHANRKTISPAELLFGFVQGDGSENALAFKGKVRISHGTLDSGTQKPHYLYNDNPLALKILGSPKPPSPALYFKHSSGFIAKKDLAELKPRPEPQGRKDYLRKEIRSGSEPWLTRHAEENITQKVRVTPIDKNKAFWFHIDFDNLSAWELGLLAFAVKPDDAYRHKLGMGKSIELGLIKIEPSGLFLVDRLSRYTGAGFNSHRYTCAWKDQRLYANLATEGYEAAAEAPNDSKHNYATFDEISSQFTSKMDKDIQNALTLIGKPLPANALVHTPQVRINGAIDDEHETFRWFVENEKKNGHQYLKPIGNKTELPPLEYIDVPEKGLGRGNERKGR